jgi:hypothetical protein
LIRDDRRLAVDIHSGNDPAGLPGQVFACHCAPLPGSLENTIYGPTTARIKAGAQPFRPPAVVIRFW